MKQEEKQFLMDVATLTSKRSKATRQKVGGVVTDAQGNLVAVGYNGSVHGSQEPLEHRIYDWQEQTTSVSLDKIKYPYHEVDTLGCYNHYRLVTNENVVVHAEQNLMAHAARRGISIDGGTVFLTLSPCTKCTSILIQCGIQEIIFSEKYRLFQETEDLYGKYVKLTKWNHE